MGLNTKVSGPQDKKTTAWLIVHKKQMCPNCGNLIGNIKGTKDAICRNCGYKDPCCE